MGNGGRLSLVIGSQCADLGPGRRLEPLRKAVTELDEVLGHPYSGACAPALPDGRSLLLNPNTTRLDTALVDAFARADELRAALVLAFVGHGLRTDKEYYVLPYDAQEDHAARNPPYFLTHRIARLLSGRPGLRSLTLILDTCESGQGAANAAEWAVLNEEDMKRRFQVLTASSLEPAYHCAFSLETARILRDGHVRHGRFLRCADIREALVQQDCLEHLPVCLGFDGADGTADLWLARNRARAELCRELRHFEAAAELGEVVAATRAHPLTVVRAPAGSGKTTLLTALTRPELHPGIPERIVHALHRLDPADDALRVATALSDGLRDTVPGFAAAHDRTTGNDAAASLLTALSEIPGEVPVRIALDGLDQIRPTHLPELRDLVNELLFQQDQELTGLRVLVSARPGTALPWPNFAAVELGAAHADAIGAYLERRGVPGHAHDLIVERSAGNWLVVTLLADWLEDHDGLGGLPAGVDDTYTRRLRLIRGEEPWEGSALCAVLTMLTVADATEGIPQRLLQQAVREVYPRANGETVSTALHRLRRLVVSRPVGDGETSYTLFHPTLSQYLTRPGHEYSVNVTAGHRAIAAALHRLAPRGRPSDGHPLYMYAAEAEATHLWERDGARAVVASLIERPAADPQANLLRWSAWRDRFERELGPDEPYVFVARAGVADWTDRCGDHASARQLFEELAEDCREGFDPDHPDAGPLLEVRHQLAAWFGADDPTTALHLCLELLPDCERALGPEHEFTFVIRNNIAAWTDEVGDTESARGLWRELVTSAARELGTGHRVHLVARNGVAIGLAQTDAVAAAVADWGALLVDVERYLGRDDDLARDIRRNIVTALSPLVEAAGSNPPPVPPRPPAPSAVW
ncbi:tetratricopeptide repeat protein [Streptomyces sp. NPDC059582]|uniref:tetratricopeptide repeat protein n=1 Tax=Streptomyces sp. NPDC059582 TaxID=3346875 RepID=UPI003678AEA5